MHKAHRNSTSYLFYHFAERLRQKHNSTGNKSQVLDRALNMTNHEVYADFVHTSYLSLASSL